MDLDEFNFPDDRKYDNRYTWVKIDGDTAELGITEPAAKQVKEFVFIDFPKKSGENISKGETFCSLESVKWSGHLESPISGEIIETNDSVFDQPKLLNDSPYENWIVKIKITDKKEISSLRDSPK